MHLAWYACRDRFPVICLRYCNYSRCKYHGGAVLYCTRWKYHGGAACMRNTCILSCFTECDGNGMCVTSKVNPLFVVCSCIPFLAFSAAGLSPDRFLRSKWCAARTISARKKQATTIRATQKEHTASNTLTQAWWSSDLLVGFARRTPARRYQASISSGSHPQRDASNMLTRAWSTFRKNPARATLA